MTSPRWKKQEAGRYAHAELGVITHGEVGWYWWDTNAQLSIGPFKTLAAAKKAAEVGR